MTDRLNATLQENLITLLCHSDQQGGIVARLVDPNLFEGDIRVIAERAIEYWRVHKEAPRFHTPDLVADIINDPTNRKRRTYERLLTSMAELAPNVNAKYVLDQLKNFVQLQKTKSAILTSAEKINAKQHMALSEVAEIWNELLRARDVNFDVGIRLDDYEKLLAYLAERETEVDTGIKELDKKSATPARGTAYILLGPPGRGKSWFLIMIGKRALLRRKKVLHLSLELSAEQIMQRYYQALFFVSKHASEEVYLTEMKKHGFELDGLSSRPTVPNFSFDHPELATELDVRISPMSARYHNCVIKRFPPRQLTANGLRAYLDNLEVTEGFIPDMLILDYIGVMKTDERNHRISLGRLFEEFRAVTIERNIAGVTAHQVSKKAVTSGTTAATHVAEDWSIIGTADVVLSYSCTDSEFNAGLGRLYVSKNRDELDRFGVVLTQNYACGQFVLESAPLSAKYEEIRDDFIKDDDDHTKSGSDDEDDEDDD